MTMYYYGRGSTTTYRDGSSSNTCTCGECPPTKISNRTATRIMHGILQAMDDLRRETKGLEPQAALDDLNVRCAYPYNWIPRDACNPRREALIGVHNILLVIYAIMEQGNLPDTEAIRDVCEKESESLHHTSDYIECGGTVSHVLIELTSQVESDINGEALYVDAEELQESLEQIRPCALDDRLEYWREALGIL